MDDRLWGVPRIFEQVLSYGVPFLTQKLHR